ncbi:MAG: pre-peptidase C-terminal domain-containing protein, partial [Bacteroidota bacterium]
MKKYFLSALCLLTCCCWGIAQSVICERAITIRCGQSIESNNFTTPNSLLYNDYGTCTADLPRESAPFDGRDVIYKVDVGESTNLSISLTQLTADLDVFVFADICGNSNDFFYTESNCVARSVNSNNSSESITIDDAFGVYYIVIDAQFANNRSGYRLTVNCSEGDPCDDFIPIECGQTIRANNFQGTSRFDRNDYRNCHTTNSPFDGIDQVFRIDVPNNVTEITAQLFGLAADLDLFIYNRDCTPGNCLGASTGSGTSTESIRITNAAGARIYFIVDAPTANIASNFSFRIICKDPCEDIEPYDGNCDDIDYDYIGSAGNLRYEFSVPNTYPSGSWTARRGFSTLPLGAGNTRAYTFSTGGEYEVCYNYKNADGCDIRCCKTIFVENPYDCDNITATKNDDTYTLSLPSIIAANVSLWQNDDTGASVGTRVNTVTVPKPARGECVNYSAFFFDHTTDCYRICCIQVCGDNCEDIEDLNCDELSFQFVAFSTELGTTTYEFSVPSTTNGTGSWTLEDNGAITEIGTGRTVRYSSSRQGTFLICYTYTNEEGCSVRCCKRIVIRNPY